MGAVERTRADDYKQVASSATVLASTKAVVQLRPHTWFERRRFRSLADSGRTVGAASRG